MLSQSIQVLVMLCGLMQRILYSCFIQVEAQENPRYQGLSLFYNQWSILWLFLVDQNWSIIHEILLCTIISRVSCIQPEDTWYTLQQHLSMHLTISPQIYTGEGTYTTLLINMQSCVYCYYHHYLYVYIYLILTVIPYPYGRVRSSLHL